MWKITDRLLDRRDITKNGCWEYTLCKDRKGYGRMHCGDKTERVHRIAYREWVGPIGELMVCHKCDNPPCFNPDHLFLGTSKDNQLDAVSKGTIHGKVFIGTNHWNHKLSEKQVEEIKEKYKPHVYTMKMLCDEYNMSIGGLQKIIYGNRWLGKTKGE